MSSGVEFTLEGFYTQIAQGKVAAVRCRVCGEFAVPSTLACTKCASQNFEWVELRGSGRVVSFSEVHVPNKDFQGKAPYVVAVIEMDEGARMVGMLKNATRRDVSIDSKVKVVVDTESNAQPKYFFTLV